MVATAPIEGRREFGREVAFRAVLIKLDQKGGPPAAWRGPGGGLFIQNQINSRQGKQPEKQADIKSKRATPTLGHVHRNTQGPLVFSAISDGTQS
jgi:hypothetical protein